MIGDNDIVGSIKKQLLEGLSAAFLDKPVAIEDYEVFVKVQLCSIMEVSKEHILVTAAQDPDEPRKIIVKPKNLYTLLLLHEINVPYILIKDLDEWETPKGTFAMVDGEPTFRPVVPLNYIEISIPIQE
jgi:hypothetical protein